MPLVAVSIFGESTAGHKRVDFLPDGQVLSGYQFPTTALDETLNRSLSHTDRTIFLSRDEVQDGFLIWIGLYQFSPTTRRSAGGKGVGIWLHNSTAPGDVTFPILRRLADKVPDDFFLAGGASRQWSDVDENYSLIGDLKSEAQIGEPFRGHLEIPYKYGLVDLTLAENRINTVGEWLTAVQERHDLSALKGVYISPGTEFCNAVRTTKTCVDLSFEQVQNLFPAETPDLPETDNNTQYPSEHSGSEADEGSFSMDERKLENLPLLQSYIDLIRSTVRDEMARSSGDLRDKLRTLQLSNSGNVADHASRVTTFKLLFMVILILLTPTVGLTGYSAWLISQINKSLSVDDINSKIRFDETNSNLIINTDEINKELFNISEKITSYSRPSIDSRTSQGAESLPYNPTTSMILTSSDYGLIRDRCVKALNGLKRKQFDKQELLQLLQGCINPP